MPPRLQLLVRPGCGLCKEMARELHALRVHFDEVDIEQDQRRELAYGEAVPVLLLEGRELARAPQTSRTLKRVLTRAGLLSGVR